MPKAFYAAIWTGIQSFETCIEGASAIDDIIAHGQTLEQCRERLQEQQTNIQDDVTIRKFVIVKVEHIEDVDLSIKEEV